MNPDIAALTETIRQESQPLERVLSEMSKVIVGQRELLERMLIALLTRGHLLLEGVPGLAKTLAVKTLAQVLDLQFRRIQFTPDLLPADLTGTMVFSPKTGDFHTKKGPVFTNLLLADEINRAPAKVQSALLEAMQERQVTIGETSHPLPQPFLVMATQNPIEQEGTYPLPEAQVDRFLLKVKIAYPSPREEKEIVGRVAQGTPPPLQKVCTPADLTRLVSVCRSIYVDERIKDYIVALVVATRDPAKAGLDKLKNLIQFGASPRASIVLTEAARAVAFIQRRAYVTPDDVKSIARDALRHRLILTYEAEAEERTSDDLIDTLLAHVPVP